MNRYVDGHKAIVLLDRALDDFVTDETDKMFKAMSKAGKLAKNDLQKSNAFKDVSGSYRKGWSIKTKREKYGVNVLLYNKTDPRLTHLLEKGHVVINKYGRVGRAPAHPHIKIAKEKAEEYLIDELMKDL